MARAPPPDSARGPIGPRPLRPPGAESFGGPTRSEDPSPAPTHRPPARWPPPSGPRPPPAGSAGSAPTHSPSFRGSALGAPGRPPARSPPPSRGALGSRVRVRRLRAGGGGEAAQEPAGLVAAPGSSQGLPRPGTPESCRAPPPTYPRDGPRTFRGRVSWGAAAAGGRVGAAPPSAFGGGGRAGGVGRVGAAWSPPFPAPVPPARPRPEAAAALHLAFGFLTHFCWFPAERKVLRGSWRPGWRPAVPVARQARQCGECGHRGPSPPLRGRPWGPRGWERSRFA